MVMQIVGVIDKDMLDLQCICFCEWVCDYVLQIFYNCDKGWLMKLFDEDGSDGVWIINYIICCIYVELQIFSLKKVEVFGWVICNEMMGMKFLVE